MRASRTTLVVAALTAVVASVVAERATQADGGPKQTTRLVNFQGPGADGSKVKGSRATLVRTADGIAMSIDTRELPIGAYTNWWLVFNNPGACDGECDFSDRGNPLVQAGGFYATGGIVGPDGRGHFSASAMEGVLPTGPGQILPWRSGSQY